MKYETPEAFRTALEQRLKNEAKASGTALLRLRKRVAFERFLASLAASESGGWVLKGAFALELRLRLRTRTTKDIDLGRADDEEAATEHLNAATASISRISSPSTSVTLAPLRPKLSAHTFPRNAIFSA